MNHHALSNQINISSYFVSFNEYFGDIVRLVGSMVDELPTHKFINDLLENVWALLSLTEIL